MLGGRISNQDEEEVEDELAALEAEILSKQKLPQQPLPNVPETEPLPSTHKTPKEEDEVQSAEAAEGQKQREAMLA